MRNSSYKSNNKKESVSIGPILWRGSASMGFSKSRVEDEWFGETHTSASDSQDWNSWKIEKVASGGWVKHKVPVLNTKCQYCTILTLSVLLSDLYDKFLYMF